MYLTKGGDVPAILAWDTFIHELNYFCKAFPISHTEFWAFQTNCYLEISSLQAAKLIKLPHFGAN